MVSVIGDACCTLTVRLSRSFTSLQSTTPVFPGGHSGVYLCRPHGVIKPLLCPFLRPSDGAGRGGAGGTGGGCRPRGPAREPRAGIVGGAPPPAPAARPGAGRASPPGPPDCPLGRTAPSRREARSAAPAPRAPSVLSKPRFGCRGRAARSGTAQRQGSPPGAAAPCAPPAPAPAPAPAGWLSARRARRRARQPLLSPRVTSVQQAGASPPGKRAVPRSPLPGGVPELTAAGAGRASLPAGAAACGRGRLAEDLQGGRQPL